MSVTASRLNNNNGLGAIQINLRGSKVATAQLVHKAVEEKRHNICARSIRARRQSGRLPHRIVSSN